MKNVLKTLLLASFATTTSGYMVLAQSCSIFAGNDTAFCMSPTTLNLNAQISGTLNSCSDISWTPQAGLNNPTILNPIATISSSIAYTVNASFPFGPNLIVNGDFEDGNIAFINTYSYNCPSSSAIVSNEYCITDNPNNVHPSAASCSDHTSGSGLMMVVNGATVFNSEVWSQTIPVSVNTDYSFTFWSMNWSSFTTYLPTFHIVINGIVQNQSFSINPLQCSWKESCLTWNSGSSTTATFQIINEVDYYSGNDFAIDDVVLQALCLASDTIQITVGDTINQMFDTTVCQGSLVSLFAASGNVSWLPSNGLNCDSCQTVTFAADSSIIYIASGVDSFCFFVDSFQISVDSLPFLLLPDDTFTCKGSEIQILAQGTSGVIWTSDSSLSCINCLNPIANPDTTTTYYVSTSNGMCEISDSITILIMNPPAIAFFPDTNICQGLNVILSLDTGYNYLWSPPQGLSCNDCAAPIASPDSTITYNVVVLDSGCITIDTITIFVSYNDSVNAGLADSICEGKSVQLAALGANDYLWSPSFSLNDANISNPVANPTTTTEYVVHGNDACGETADSVIIFVFKTPSVFSSYDSIIYCHSGVQIQVSGESTYIYHWLNSDLVDPSSTTISINPSSSEIYTLNVSNGMCDTLLTFPILVSNISSIVIPNAFTPNSDGVNDIFSIMDYCPISLKYFRIFNRWGQMIFETNDLTMGWDGNYKNIKCPIDVYVYSILALKQSGDALHLSGNVTLIR
ncbi:MAG: gliding motility-associated C-terminal domain-containing protein [Chitinophagales bacterium]|nr:gliding motility-associated C-terminal domain-containing protein [Chitinophagales bacterium]